MKSKLVYLSPRQLRPDGTYVHSGTLRNVTGSPLQILRKHFARLGLTVVKERWGYRLSDGHAVQVYWA